MLDDIREWISDNLRYILLGLAVLLALVIIFCIVRLATGSGKNPKSSGDDKKPVQEAVTESDEVDAQPATAAPAPTEELVRNEPAVLGLVKKYYDAAAEKDTGTLSQIVDPWNDEVSSSILDNDVIESYNNITTYSKKGLSEGSYVVYAYYDSKITGIDTLVPSLSRLYVVTNDAGDLVVSSNADTDPEIADYITSVSSDADVQALIADVNRQYQTALDSDETLKEYINNLSTSTDEGGEEEGSGDEGGTVEANSEMTAIAGLNIRQEPSTDSAIMGIVSSGTNVTVLSDAGDGWVKIHYGYAGSDVDGYVRLEYLTEPTG